jgi:hypothetical protein
MNDKIIVTNLGALKKKYGAKGLGKIRAAIKALIAADKARGFSTRLLALDSAPDMKKVKGAAVTKPSSPRQNKDAIDAVFAAIRPDYLMILGAVDVVPHQDLINPMFQQDDDLDDPCWGDIPYACDQPYSRQPDKFIGPTRVVGRLPDITSGKDPEYLIGLLRTAAGWKSLTRQEYSDYFAITAQPWKKSTSMSLERLFGASKNLNVTPAAGPKWTNAQLARRSHFINCHGNTAEPTFFGQKGNEDVFPDAHRAAWVTGKITEGTVASVECCYGGELYDPALAAGQPGICNTYLAGKAYGYFGSSTIAYGPADSNGAADLLCQNFLRLVLAGASLGRAALQARQDFALAGPDVDPADMKTLAQFSLFGDPSIHPVAAPTPHTMTASGFAKGARTAGAAAGKIPANLSPIVRAERRKQALEKGLFISNTQAVACRTTDAKATSSLAKALLKLAAAAKITKPKMMTFRIKPGTAPAGGSTAKRAFAGLAAKTPKPNAYHVAMSSRKSDKQRSPKITALIAKEAGGKIVSYRTLVSR